MPGVPFRAKSRPSLTRTSYTPSAGAATVTGNARSSTGKVHEVIVRMKSNGFVRIQVVTPRRTLRFKSRYASRRG